MKGYIDIVFHQIFFLREFHPMVFALDDVLYHHIKTLIGFWCKQELNPKYFI